jgi:hypothetical protein
MIPQLKHWLVLGWGPCLVLKFLEFGSKIRNYLNKNQNYAVALGEPTPTLVYLK